MQQLEKVKQGVTELTTPQLVQVLHILDDASPSLRDGLCEVIEIVHAEYERREKTETTPPEKARFYAKKRNLNAKGRGTETYRLLGSLDGDTLDWADNHPSAMVLSSDWGPRGYRASERKCAMIVEADVNLLVVEIEKTVGSGASASYRAGRTWGNSPNDSGIIWDHQPGCRVRHCGIKKRNGSFVHVVEVDGVRREYTSG